MAKIRLACPCGLVDRVTGLLQDAGVLHIESAPPEAMQLPLRPQMMDESARQRQAELERLRDDLHRLLLLLPDVPPSSSAARSPSLALPLEGGLRRGSVERGEGGGSGQRDRDNWKHVVHLVRQVGSRADYLTGRLKECEEELALLSKYARTLEALSPFLSLVKESEELDHLGITMSEEARGGPPLPLLHEMMARVTDNRYELFHARLDDRTLAVLLVFPKTYSSRIRQLLSEEGISELRLPASVSEKPLGQALRIILKKKLDLPLRAQRYRRELAELAGAWRQELARRHEAVIRRLEQIEASALFFQTQMASLIYGWVPRRAFPALKASLEKAFGGTVVVEECPLGRQEWGKVPVALRNPGPFKPFEVLTRLIALPQYGSIDPTPYLAVFFPLFYGMILGDAGYGLVIFLTAVIVHRRYGHHPLVRDLSAVFVVASGVSILFGLLFGELFGEVGERIGLHPVLNRMEAFIPLLWLSIAIGTVHVTLGIILGALWAWRHGQWHECLVKLGALLLVLSFVSLIAGLADLLPRASITYAALGLLLALPVILVFGGARGAWELHNLVNVLSYLRLMGIGVASAALAFAANKLGGMVGNLVLALVVGGTLHAINLVFGLLSPTIQSLRLHYVEFFENFFAPGGKPYKPFRRRET